MVVKTPTERCIELTALGDDGNGTALVQVDRALGIVNHRLYRQAMNYKVSFSTMPLNRSQSSSFMYAFYTLPNNWLTHAAIRLAYRQWQMSIQNELQGGVKLAKWYDFRINEQDPDGVWDVMAPTIYDGDGSQTLSPDEYLDTTLIASDGSTSKGFHLFGTVSNSYNVFDEYRKLREQSIPADPSVASTEEAYAGLQVGMEDQANLTEAGDKPPYDYDLGSNWTKTLVYQGHVGLDLNGGYEQKSTKTFTAPLGLVFIRKKTDGSSTDFSTSNGELCLHLSPGGYKGVAAESIVA